MSCMGPDAFGILGGDHIVVHLVRDPYTNAPLSLVPPIELNDPADPAAFNEWITGYCKAARDSGMVTAGLTIDASNWREGLPAGI